MRTCLVAILAATTMLATGASAQRNADADAEAEGGEDWYYQSESDLPTPQMIIREKAQARAAARIRRIETTRAYGMSNSRPTASCVPHTSLYSPVWQMPGGRPFGWYTTNRPQYILWR